MPVALALLSACNHDGLVIEQTQVCAGWREILVSKDDQLTEGTATQIEAHNENGVARKCWEPPK